METITQVQIVSVGPTATQESTQITIGTTDTVLKSTGLSALVQRVVKLLLTTPGTNVVYPEEGVGVLSLLGTNSADLGDLTSRVSSLIEGVQSYLLDDPNYFNLPTSEQLTDIAIDALLWDRETQTVRLDVRINAQDGNSTVSRVEI